MDFVDIKIKTPISGSEWRGLKGDSVKFFPNKWEEECKKTKKQRQFQGHDGLNSKYIRFQVKGDHPRSSNRPLEEH